MSKIYTLFYGGGFDDNNPPVFSTNNNGVNKKELKKMVKSELNKSLGKSIDKTVEKSVDKAIDKAVNDMDIKLEGENLDYKLMVNGNENGEINIPKDQFLKTIAYDSDAKKLIFTIETTEGEKVTEVNISELVAPVEEEIAAVDAKVDAIVIPDTTNFATKDEVEAVDAKIPDVSNFATKDEIPDVSNFASKDEIPDVSNFATKDELPDVSNFATKDEIPSTDNLATKDELSALDAKIDAIEIPSIDNLATKAEVEAVDAKIPDTSNFATKDEVDDKMDSAAQAVGNAIDNAVMGLASEEYVDNKVANLVTREDLNNELSTVATMAYVDNSIEGLASEEYVDNTVEGYVPVEQYNDLKSRLDEIEKMLDIYNAEREAQMDEIINNMSSDNKEVVIDTLMESIVVPETTVAYTITAPLTDNSTVELTSPKYMTLINTSKEPVSTTISHNYVEGETTTATSVYLVGDFDTLTIENVSPSVKSGYDAASVKNVVIPETNVKNLSLALDFQDGATITNNSDKDITITDKNDSAIALTIVAPNSTVTLSNGQFTTLNAEVSDNTLIIKKNVHIANLTLEKGNAVVEVARQEEVADIVENYTVADGYSVSHRIYHITNENSSKLGGIGEMILDEDIVRTASLVAPLSPAYDAVWDMNNHNLTVEGTPKNGVYLNRYFSNLEVSGNGIIHSENSYGLWNNTANGKIVVNDGVTVEAQTHAIYAEKGIIEINGGTFKLTNWADADKDGDGNLRFLLNCLDANYKNSTANIIVRRGKFYDFNPGNCAAEGVGTSFLAEGYVAVESTETIDGVEHKVYTVVEDGE